MLKRKKKYTHCEIVLGWVCSKCGRENMTEMEHVEMTPEEKEEKYREDFGLEAWESVPDEIEHMLLEREPREVQCKKCKSKFLNCRYRKDGEDDTCNPSPFNGPI